MVPANDNFSEATRLWGQSFSIHGSDVGTTVEIDEPFYEPTYEELVHSVWYQWIAPVSGNFILHSVGTWLDYRHISYLGLYIGDSLDELQKVGRYTQLPVDNETYKMEQIFDFETTEGTTYWIQMASGYDGGVFRITLDPRGDSDSNQLHGSRFRNFIYGGGGNDLIQGYKGHDYLVGEKGDDVVKGGSGHDTLVGGEDDDVLVGGEGDDYLDGGNGHDTLYGNAGRNYLDGGAGDNAIFGGRSRDIIVTEDGNDRIYSNGGSDTIVSGTGFDHIWVEGDTRVRFLLGIGHDLIHNFSLGQTSFSVENSLGFSDLLFRNSPQGTKIFYQNDLLAILIDARVNDLINSPDTFV